MRPRLIVRLLTSLILAVLFALGVGMVAISLGLVDPRLLYTVVEWPYISFQNALITAVAGAAFMVVAVLLIAGLNRRRADKKSGDAVAVISRGELGTSSITLAALDEMVRRHCSVNPGIRSTEAAITVLEDKLAIALKLGMAPDANVAAVTSQLRVSLVECIQELTGIGVSDVSILVVTAPDQKIPNVKA